MLTIKEVSKRSGITIRTLHYYDEIDLFKPIKLMENGYRLYGEESLLKLQEILFFREIGFGLKEIKNIIENPSYDREKGMKMQREVLEKKINRLESLINLIDKNIADSKIVKLESFNEEEINMLNNKYKKEVEEMYGNTKEYKEFEEKNYKQKDGDVFQKDIEVYFKKFEEVMNKDPNDKEVKDLVHQWRNYISDNFYNCSKEMLLNLGEMYINDSRFKKNIDKNKEGLAEFVNLAIKEYCK